MSFDGSTINIILNENPIIQSVVVNGIDENDINKKIRELTLKIEKYPFVESNINEQVNLIKNILRSYGYYNVELQTSLKNNDNNTVDLTYEVNLEKISKIKKIKFIGNKVFRDSTLRNIIISEETKFWKFITKNKFLDINRVNADVFRLQNFYKNRGFFNVKIKSTTAVITESNHFELIFNINAGNKFYFNSIQINAKNSEVEVLDQFAKKFKN